MFRRTRSWSVRGGDAEFVRERLATAAVFAGAPEDAVARLAALADVVTVRSGTDLVREGRIPTHLYVITSGIFDVFSTGESSGQVVKVASLQAGDHFGEIGIIEGMPSTASVRAAGEAVAIRIPARDFLDVVREAPELARSVRMRAARKLAHTHPSYAPGVTEVVLTEAGDAFGSAMSLRSLDELLRSITATAVNLFRAASCSIALVDEATGELVFRAATGAGAEKVMGARIAAGEGIAGAVLASGVPVVVTDVDRDARFAGAFAASTGFKPTAIVARPLDVQGTIVGVIEVLDPERVDERTTTLLGLFSNQAALAIQTGRALQELVDALAGWNSMSGAEKRAAIARIRGLLGA
ncbi:MAG TPA: cyclic nucleotide-binding domain-containing protein [Actinomycetota bacterium]|nr:cyclic nucleotide-binding domain-containing protein [Actinomycetota bacterium]